MTPETAVIVAYAVAWCLFCFVAAWLLLRRNADPRGW